MYAFYRTIIRKWPYNGDECVCGVKTTGRDTNALEPSTVAGRHGLTKRRCFEDGRSMTEDSAIERLSAIAHRTRLAVFRLLVQEGDEGLPAGEIARRLEVPPTTMSTHLAVLTRANLIKPRRESRTVFYALKPEGVQELLTFLMADCCDGRPELCAPLGQQASNCTPKRKR
jgi:DNA-binding transcriptional ArsR family regulator